MAEYCTAQDVQNRLTESGLIYAADRDGDGAVSPGEMTAHVTSAIQYAGNLIDAAIASYLLPANARGQGNSWLRDRCVDIACARVTSNGGDEVPERIGTDAEKSMDMLDEVRSGDLHVPGLTIPPPYNSDRRTRGLPRAVNPR